MSFEIDQYELDYDDQPPTPTSNNGLANESREYGSALPSYLLEETAPEDPTQTHSSGVIGPQIPTQLMRSTWENAQANVMEPFGEEEDSANNHRSNWAHTTSNSHFNENGRCEGTENANALLFGSTPSPPTINNTASSSKSVNATTNGNKIIGPTIPSFLLSTTNEDSCDNDNNCCAMEPSSSTSKSASRFQETSDDEDLYGPALPPSLLPSENDHEHQKKNNKNEEEQEQSIFGPVMPPESNGKDEHDDEYYYRLMQLQEKKASTSKATRREEWMTELPQTLSQNYGLSAKSSFSSSSAIPSSSADKARSEWTRTPTEVSTKKATPTVSTKLHSIKSTSNNNNKETVRQESLMESHQRKRRLSNGQEIPAKIGERIPFNRDIDMEVHSLSKITGEEAKNRAGNLVTRFEPSSSKRFL